MFVEWLIVTVFLFEKEREHKMMTIIYPPVHISGVTVASPNKSYELQKSFYKRHVRHWHVIEREPRTNSYHQWTQIYESTVKSGMSINLKKKKKSIHKLLAVFMVGRPKVEKK